MSVIMKDVTNELCERKHDDSFSIMKIECRDVTVKEFRQAVNKFNKTPNVHYDPQVCLIKYSKFLFLYQEEDDLLDCDVYIVSSGTRYYTIKIDKDNIFFGVLTYHVEGNPYPRKLWDMFEEKTVSEIDFETLKRKPLDYDKRKYCIDEFDLLIDKEKGIYDIHSEAHDLYGSSGFRGCASVTNNPNKRSSKGNANALIYMAYMFLNELIAVFPNVVEILNLLDFDILPSRVEVKDITPCYTVLLKEGETPKFDSITQIMCYGTNEYGFYEATSEFNKTPNIYYPKDYCLKKVCDQFLFPYYGRLMSDQKVYVITRGNHYYTLTTKPNGKLSIGRITYHDEKDPFPGNIYDMLEYMKEDYDINKKQGLDKRHIDEFAIEVNPITQKYSMICQKHALMGSSGGGCFYVDEEGNHTWEPVEGKDTMKALLIMKEQLINELTEMGVVNGQLIDLNAFSIIPKPDDYKGKRKIPEIQN